eukprot:TRINITY_DN24886_c0_g2_i1.p1 TRINITY_DN24886_c0_g2~~TRINITY_DN24886_c0_g2_i1.p1  ORF type:complete len:407 (-),score=60.25 TRINITY_DN24886_c0_g2_i1:217-1437(-)
MMAHRRCAAPFGGGSISIVRGTWSCARASRRLWDLVVIAATLMQAAADGSSMRGKASFEDQSRMYLVGSFPQLRQVHYALLPDTMWRPLIVEGIDFPGSVLVDQANSRLYVVDEAKNAIVWYQLKVLKDDVLSTYGVQHVAVTGVVARGLALDAVGSLFIAGRRLSSTIAPPDEAILTKDAVGIATGESHDSNVLAEIWTRSNSLPTSGSTPRLWMASAVGVDPVHVYWANEAQGVSSGSVVEATRIVPKTELQGALRQLGTGQDSVKCLALTPVSILYGAPGGIYGVSKLQIGSQFEGCSDTDSSGSSCGQLVPATDPTCIVWDGEGTMYVADAGDDGGTVFSFPSGSLSKHMKKNVLKAEGIQGIGIFRGTQSDNSGAASTKSNQQLVAFALPWTVAFFPSRFL